MQYPGNRLRIALDVKAEPGSAIDSFSSASASTYWACDLRIDIALYQSGVLLDPSNIATLNVEMKPFEDHLAKAVIDHALASFIDSGNTLTDATWADGSNQHATVGFTGTTIKTINMNGATSINLWCVVWGTTQANANVVWGAFVLTVVNSGASIP